MKTKTHRLIVFLLLELVCVLLLLWPAFLNGYPLLAPDSGAYIGSGHSSIVPIDRPIVYGLFVRHISLSWSLWLVILMQSVLFNYLIYLICKLFLKVKQPALLQLGIIAFLVFGTTLAGYSSVILADIFTALSLLSLFLLLYLKKDKKKHLMLLSIILVFSILTHLSHLPLLMGELLVVAFFIGINRSERDRMKRLLKVSALVFGSILLLASLNFSLGAGFKLARTTNIIWATRFLEGGIVNKHLKKVCTDANQLPYQELCNYIDQFDQWYGAGIYLYDYATSPLYQDDCMEDGWGECWLEKDEAYGELINHILSDPELRTAYLNLIVEGTVKQLITFQEPHLAPFQFPFLIQWHFKNEWKQFEASRQYKQKVDFTAFNKVEFFVIVASTLLLLLFILIKWRKLSFEDQLLLIIVMAALIGNALLTASLSNVSPRYEGRIIFLIPLTVICLFFRSRLKKS